MHSEASITDAKTWKRRSLTTKKKKKKDYRQIYPEAQMQTL